MQAVTITQITPLELSSLIKSSLQDILGSMPIRELEQPDVFLNVEQTAAFLGLAVPTIYGLVSKRDIPTLKRGKRLYFIKKDIEQWLRAGKKQTTADYAAEANEFLTHK